MVAGIPVGEEVVDYEVSAYINSSGIDREPLLRDNTLYGSTVIKKSEILDEPKLD